MQLTTCKTLLLPQPQLLYQGILLPRRLQKLSLQERALLLPQRQIHLQVLTPSPSSSVDPSPPGPSLRDQLENSYVILFIVAIIVVGLAQFVLMILGSRKRHSVKPSVSLQFSPGTPQSVASCGKLYRFWSFECE